MTTLAFPPLPQEALLQLGGFTFVQPAAWRRYLNSAATERYQAPWQESSLSEQNLSWLENGCVLQSLEQYMFDQFGVVVPQENLFRYYNPLGEGVSPADMLEAIAAVIEPLGFEIDLVLAADEELGKGLGCPEKVRNLTHAADFEGKSGLCMINVHAGYSHAFYWRKMETAKFFKEQFRLAVLVKRQDGSQPPQRSLLDSLEAYRRLLKETLLGPGAVSPAPAHLLSEVEELCRYARSHRNRQGSRFRANVERRLLALLALVEENRLTGPCLEENETLLAAGLLICRAFREIDDPAVARPTQAAPGR
jgi:hypothetical protein